MKHKKKNIPYKIIAALAKRCVPVHLVEIGFNDNQNQKCKLAHTIGPFILKILCIKCLLFFH